MSKALFVLYEGPTGYAVFKRIEGEEIGSADLEYQKAMQKFAAFGSTVALISFAPYSGPESALEEAICISEGLLSEFLSDFIARTLTKKVTKGEERGWELGVTDPKLGSAIHETLGIPVVSNEGVLEMMRLVRLHAAALLPKHEDGDITRAQVGLSHAFSRNKVKFNVHRQDNMIISAAALLEHLEKGVNLLGMRVREWYGWHFPELGREVPEPFKYARIVLLIGNRETLNERAAEEVKEGLAALLEDDEALVSRVYEKAVTSMGGDMAEVDWSTLRQFAERVVSLAEYRDSIKQYLNDRMMAVAPNLTTLMGQNIGAKLITKAGSLTNLAKAPASTIQILGAEKALFRALKKKKGNTPKYGLIFHSTYIQRAAKEHRGKISRYLANKAALACRIDCFMDAPASGGSVPPVFGNALKAQVEGRLNFFDTGKKPQSNKAAMAEALEAYNAVLEKRKKKASKKKSKEETAAEDAEQVAAAAPTKKKSKN